MAESDTAPTGRGLPTPTYHQQGKNAGRQHSGEHSAENIHVDLHQSFLNFRQLQIAAGCMVLATITALSLQLSLAHRGVSIRHSSGAMALWMTGSHAPLGSLSRCPRSQNPYSRGSSQLRAIHMTSVNGSPMRTKSPKV